MSDEALPSVISFSEDINDAEAPVPLPANDYPAVIVGVTPKVSSKGTKYAEAQFRIDPADYPADFDVGNAPNGVNVFYRRVSLEDNPNARYMMKLWCTAIGAPMSKNLDMQEWVGQEAMVTVKHETYEGVTRPVIVKVAKR